MYKICEASKDERQAEKVNEREREKERNRKTTWKYCLRSQQWSDLSWVNFHFVWLFSVSAACAALVHRLCGVRLLIEPANVFIMYAFVVFFLLSIFLLTFRMTFCTVACVCVCTSEWRQTSKRRRSISRATATCNDAANIDKIASKT